MSPARTHTRFAIASVLACLASPAVAQGEQPWVDPPAREPGAPPVRAIAPPPPPAPAATPAAPVAPSREEAPPRPVQPRQAEPRIVEEPRRAGGPTPVPSFNCRYARSSVERAICADPVLAAKDRRMAVLYEQAGGSRHGPVDITQSRWLSARNACGRAPAVEACIARIYDARIAELAER